jgi:hypothetical protein
MLNKKEALAMKVLVFIGLFIGLGAVEIEAQLFGVVLMAIPIIIMTLRGNIK